MILSVCIRIVYREVKDTITGDDEGGESTPVASLYSRTRTHATCSGSGGGSVVSPATPVPSMSCTVEDVLQLLRHLFVITISSDKSTSLGK